MTMALEQERNLAIRIRAAMGAMNDDDKAVESLVRELAEFKLAHLARPSQAVDVEKVREVIAELRGWDKRYHGLHGLADKLTAALQEKGNG